MNVIPGIITSLVVYGGAEDVVIHPDRIHCDTGFVSVIHSDGCLKVQTRLVSVSTHSVTAFIAQDVVTVHNSGKLEKNGIVVHPSDIDAPLYSTLKFDTVHLTAVCLKERCIVRVDAYLPKLVSLKLYNEARIKVDRIQTFVDLDLTTYHHARASMSHCILKDSSVICFHQSMAIGFGIEGNSVLWTLHRAHIFHFKCKDSIVKIKQALPSQIEETPAPRDSVTISCIETN